MTSMEEEVLRYYKYKKNLVFMLSTYGVWPNYEKHPLILRKILNISAIISYTCLCFGVTANLFSVSDFKTFSRCISLTIGVVANFLKVTTLSMNQVKLQTLNDGISTSFESKLKLPENRRHLLAEFPTFEKFFKVFSLLSFGIGLFLSLVPLLQLRHGKYLRAFPVRVPFSYESGGTYHWILTAFELLISFYSWTVTCGFDSLFGMYSLHMVGEMRLLRYRFQKLKPSKSYRDDVRGCVKCHLLLLRTLETLQQIFGILTIWFAINSAVCLCALVFQLSNMQKFDFTKVIYMLCFAGIKVMQAYMYSWYGNMISVESKICIESAYNAHWPGSADKRIMKDVLIIIMQRPLSFKAKSFLELRMDLFAKIANTTVSYFFLLQTLEEKN